MWRDAGLFRSESSLRAVQSHVDAASRRVETLESVPGVVKIGAFEPWAEIWLDLKSMLCTASAVVVAALARNESRGAHFRSDFSVEAGGVPTPVRVRRDEAVAWRVTRV
jgi:aspartate oxidase